MLEETLDTASVNGVMQGSMEKKKKKKKENSCGRIVIIKHILKIKSEN